MIRKLEDGLKCEDKQNQKEKCKEKKGNIENRIEAS